MLKRLKWKLVGSAVLIILSISLIKFMPNPLGVTDSNTIQSANKFGIFEAIRIQKHIEKYENCPSLMPEWDSKNRLPEFQYEASIPKGASKSIPIWYICKQDLTFNIWVRHSIDSDISITGGLRHNIKISYGHFTNEQSLELSTKMEESEILLLLRKQELIADNST